MELIFINISAVKPPPTKYIGCFIDKNNRDLPTRMFADSGLMTKEICASHCIGYAYAATQVGAGVIVFQLFCPLRFIYNIFDF